MGCTDLFDGAADTPGDRRPGTLSRVAHLSGSSLQSRGLRQLVDDGVELDSSWLGARGVVLVGLDTPSVDRFDSKDLPSHHALLRHGIANLECLELGGVPAGRWELVALPLRLAGRDASPVRAVLRALP